MNNNDEQDPFQYQVTETSRPQLNPVKDGKRVKVCCSECGGENISVIAVIEWNKLRQRWDYIETYDTDEPVWCAYCDAAVDIVEEEITDDS